MSGEGRAAVDKEAWNATAVETTKGGKKKKTEQLKQDPPVGLLWVSAKDYAAFRSSFIGRPTAVMENRGGVEAFDRYTVRTKTGQPVQACTLRSYPRRRSQS